MWLLCNFSPYIIQQKGDENTQTYQEEVAILSYHLILCRN